MTDDTMMTIAVAEGILDNPENPFEDIGNVTRIALVEYKRSHDWMKASYYAHQATCGRSAGNGLLMRYLPLALYYTDVEKMLEITASQSLLTIMTQ